MGQQINLFDPSFRKQRKHFSAANMLPLLALIAACMFALYGYADYKVRQLAKTNADLEKPLVALREQLVTLVKDAAPQGRTALLSDELARAEAQLKSRQDLLGSLRMGALGNVRGFSKYLSAFARQKAEGLWLTGVTVGDDENDLVVRGRALRPDLVPAYLRALSNEEVMRGRRVTELSLSANDQVKPAVAPGQAGQGSVGSAAAQRPTHFVEFSFAAPRNGEAVKPAAAEVRRKPS